jgi:hypothetical protein
LKILIQSTYLFENFISKYFVSRAGDFKSGLFQIFPKPYPSQLLPVLETRPNGKKWYPR